MSRLIPYKGDVGQGGGTNIGESNTPVDADPDVSKRLEAVSKYVPAEILAFYLPASGAAALAGGDLVVPLQWVTFLVGWFAVPAYFFWIARGDQRGWIQSLVSWIAFPIWVAASKAFWPLPWIAPNPALALWALALFSLMTAFVLPSKRGPSVSAPGVHTGGGLQP